MACRVVGERDEEVAEFVLARVPGMDLGDYPYSAIGVVDEMGNIVGGVVFSNYTQRDVNIHVAGTGRRWLSRRLLGEVFRYVFFKLNCRRCTCMIAASNEKSLKLNLGLGFMYEGTLRKYLAGDEDAHLTGLLREDCRWLTVGELNHGKRRSREHRPADAADALPRPAGLPRDAIIAPLRRRGA